MAVQLSTALYQTNHYYALDLADATHYRPEVPSPLRGVVLKSVPNHVSYELDSLGSMFGRGRNISVIHGIQSGFVTYETHIK
jgi:hypothetical protein